MRDYLFLWFDVKLGCLVASGVEFKDVVQELPSTKSLLLFSHNYMDSRMDHRNRLSFVPSGALSKFAKENVYDYGDFVWADFEGEEPPRLSKESLAEALYLNHTAEPYSSYRISELGNEFFYHAHDDGWLLRLYAEQARLEKLCGKLVEYLTDRREPLMQVDALFAGKNALWVCADGDRALPRTYDIDKVLDENLK